MSTLLACGLVSRALTLLAASLTQRVCSNSVRALCAAPDALCQLGVSLRAVSLPIDRSARVVVFRAVLLLRAPSLRVPSNVDNVARSNQNRATDDDDDVDDVEYGDDNDNDDVFVRVVYTDIPQEVQETDAPTKPAAADASKAPAPPLPPSPPLSAAVLTSSQRRLLVRWLAAEVGGVCHAPLALPL